MTPRFTPIPFDAEFDLSEAEKTPMPSIDLGAGDFWVFGYGSLMWDPGFPHEEAQPCTVHGWHRAFCVWSNHYRGTKDRPGLVLGLAAGGSCRGRAFRVSAIDREAVLDYLYRRELVNGVYRPVPVSGRLPGGPAQVLAFVVATDHWEYAGKRSLEETAAIIAVARGKRGPNRDYLANTVAHLDQLGLADGSLHRLLGLVRRL